IPPLTFGNQQPGSAAGILNEGMQQLNRDLQQFNRDLLSNAPQANFFRDELSILRDLMQLQQQLANYQPPNDGQGGSQNGGQGGSDPNGSGKPHPHHEHRHHRGSGHPHQGDSGHPQPGDGQPPPAPNPGDNRSHGAHGDTPAPISDKI